MNNIRITNPQIFINDIEKFEIKHNVKLSEQYINFLLKFNGGYPEFSNFQISDLEGESLVNEFYGIGDMESNLSKIFDILEDVIPKGFLSIADDSGGNEICLGVKKKYFGKVYFYFHDRVAKKRMGNMVFLSNSFQEFFDSLY